MKWTIPLLAAAAIAAGCESDPKPAPQASAPPSVLDVSAPPPRYQTVSVYPAPADYSGPAYLPPPEAQPYAPPASTIAADAPPADPPRPHWKRSDRSVYTVQPGDTLYHIAKERYGDGKKWRQIAAANPDVSPTSLRVGQRLVMPE